MKRITQEDIAKRCGIDRSTVSLVFSNDPQIPASTAERVRAVARELGYTPNGQHAARRLSARRYGKTVLNRAILLLLPDYYHRANYFARIIEGIQDVLLTERVLSIISTQSMLTNSLDELPPLLADAEFDGVLYYSDTPQVQAEILPALRATMGQTLPMVGLLSATTDEALDIQVDECHGSYLAVKHLLELGHRQILFTSWNARSWALRKAGAERALRECNLDPGQHLQIGSWYLGTITPPRHLEIADLTFKDEAERSAVTWNIKEFKNYLIEHPEVTAIVAQNDALARRVAYLLRSMSLRVPDDISLIGFDDTDPLLDEVGRNILTTVRLPLEAVGAAGARQLLELVHQRTASTPIPALEPQLVLRASTASPARR